MNILTNYIGKHVIAATLVVLMVLIGIDLFILFLNEIDDIGRGDYNVMRAMWVAILQLPQFMYQFFPMAGLVGGLVGLGTLASHSELIVMRTAGVSTLQISFAVLRAALLVLIVVTLIGEVIGPSALLLSETQKAFAMSGGQALQTLNGVWMREGNTFIYVKTVNPGQQLEELHWFTLDSQQHLLSSGYAQSATYHNQQWQLKNVRETDFTDAKHVDARFFPELAWSVKLNPKLLELTKIGPSEMPLNKLYRYMTYRRQNALQAGNYELVFWQRIFQPFATLVMVFLAIPFIFGPLRSVAMGLRIVAGIGAGLLFYFINQLFGPVSLVYQLPPFWSAATPVLVFTGLAGFLVWRTRN